MYLTIVFAGTYVLLIAAMTCQTLVLRRFLASTPSIATDDDLERFKKVARLGMYLTAVSLPFLLAGLVSSVLVTRRDGGPGLLVVLVSNAVLFAVGKYGKKTENLARGLPSPSPELAAEYGRISATWTGRLFPNF